MTTIFTLITASLFGLLLLQSLRRPEWALLLVIYALPLEQLLKSYIPFLAQNTSVTNLIVGVVALTSVGIEYLRGRQPFRGYGNIATIFVGLLYVFTIVGMIWTPMMPAAKQFITAGIPYYGLLLVLLPALASVEGLRRIRVPLVLVGCAIVGLILLSPRTVFYGTRMFIDLSHSTGSRDSRGNPLVIGELGGTILIAASLMGGGLNRPLFLLLRIGAGLLGLTIAALSAARGQLIFAVMVSVLCYPLANEVKNIKQFLLKGCTVGMMLLACYGAFKLVLSGSAEVSQRWSAQEMDDGLGARVYYARELLGAYLGRPAYALQGLGTGSFNTYVPTDSDHYIYPHNLFVEVLGEHGLVGLLLLCGVLAGTGLAAKRLIVDSANDPYYRPVIGFAIAMCGFMFLIAMKQGSYVIMPIPFHWFLVLCKIERRYRLHEAAAYAHDGVDPAWHDHEDGEDEAQAQGVAG